MTYMLRWLVGQATKDKYTNVMVTVELHQRNLKVFMMLILG